jgi:two-component system, chemotaxis family, sensor kinase CheA
MRNFDLKKYRKYRGILVSIVLFIILDASVMMMNFYISFQISDDAVGVNIAGRQRMLSQRMMKSLLDMEFNLQNPAELQRASNELHLTTTLFDKTLLAFDEGGVTRGATGDEVTLKKAADPASLAAISAAKEMWQPYHGKINRLFDALSSGEKEAISTSLTDAIAFGRADNLKLLKEMNNLTVALERVASSKANNLRMVQMIGISLALINFFIIIFHSFRQLKGSDEKIEAARKETKEILDTVSEGLFLVDHKLIIGDQHSQVLEKIFARQDLAGKHFEELMSDLVSEKDLSTAQSYIQLLFKKSVKQALIGDLNPLQKVEIHLPQADGSYESKYLKFSFSRVQTKGSISHILVTVSDITQEVKLQKELEETRGQSEQQLEMITSLLHTNSDLIPAFLDNSFKTFSLINQILKTPAKTPSAYKEKASKLFSLMHNFKGEASALGLERFVQIAHQFEDTLERIKLKPDLGGNDFLPLTMQLNELMHYGEAAKKLVAKIASLASPEDQANVQPLKRKNWDHLKDLSRSIARRQNKSVELVTSGLNDVDLPDELYQAINSISVQFIRNAVTHGIETAIDRAQAQKREKGEMRIHLYHKDDGSLQYVFEDDGAGIDPDTIRQKAIESGMISLDQAELMDRKQMISLIFDPNFSTRETVDEDAGRGVGMSAIQDSIKSLRGKINIANRRGYGCKFTVTFPPMASKAVMTA